MTTSPEQPSSLTAALPPPPPSAWPGTPAQYQAAMNAAGFTWNPQRHYWDWAGR